MNPAFIGCISRKGRTVNLKEAESNFEGDATEFKVGLELLGEEVELDLAELRLFKKHLAEAERRLLLRYDAVTRRSNKSFDFE